MENDLDLSAKSDPLTEKMKEDMAASIKRAITLREQRSNMEQALSNMNREILSLESVVSYIRSTLQDKK